MGFFPDDVAAVRGRLINGLGVGERRGLDGEGVVGGPVAARGTADPVFPAPVIVSPIDTAIAELFGLPAAGDCLREVTAWRP